MSTKKETPQRPRPDFEGQEKNLQPATENNIDQPNPNVKSDLVSTFKDSFNPAVVCDLPVLDVLEKIRTGETIRDQILTVREIYQKEGKSKHYSEEKRKLPGITFGGTFGYRDEINLIQPTGIIIADLDQLGEQTDQIFNKLVQDKYIWFCFRSPSFDGIKAGLWAEDIQNGDDHKRLYLAIERYFKETYDLKTDPNCKDIPRLCYFSYDPDIYINKDPLGFNVNEWILDIPEEEPGPPPNPADFNPTPSKTEYAKKVLESCCNAIKQSQPGEQHHTRLNRARLLGGYLSYIPEQEVCQALEQAVKDSGAKDMQAAMKTVHDGLEHGKKNPIPIPDIKNSETSQNNEELDLSSALVDAENFINIEIPPKTLFLKPWLLSHQIIMVSGWRNSGKTMFVLSLLDNITKGQPFGPWNCEMTDSVLYADGEMVADDVIERLNGFGLGNRYSKLWIYNDYYASILGLPRANLLNPKWREAMKKLLIDNGIKIWAVDNLASLSPGIDENSKADWDPINQWFLDLRYQGITSILVHHTGKGGQQRGTSSREDNIDISIGLEKPSNYHTEDGAKFICKFHKARIKTADLSSIKDYEFQLTEEKGKYQWTYRDEQADKKRQVLVMLDEGIAQKDIADELMVNKSYVTKVKNRATQDGLLRKDGRLTQTGLRNCKENVVN